YTQFIAAARRLRDRFAAFNAATGGIPGALGSHGSRCTTCPAALTTIVAHMLCIQAACLVSVDGAHACQVRDAEARACTQPIQIAVYESRRVCLQQRSQYLIHRR